MPGCSCKAGCCGCLTCTGDMFLGGLPGTSLTLLLVSGSRLLHPVDGLRFPALAVNTLELVLVDGLTFPALAVNALELGMYPIGVWFAAWCWMDAPNGVHT